MNEWYPRYKGESCFFSLDEYFFFLICLLVSVFIIYITPCGAIVDLFTLREIVSFIQLPISNLLVAKSIFSSSSIQVFLSPEHNMYTLEIGPHVDFAFIAFCVSGTLAHQLHNLLFNY